MSSSYLSHQFEEVSFSALSIVVYPVHHGLEDLVFALRKKNRSKLVIGQVPTGIRKFANDPQLTSTLSLSEAIISSS